MDHLEALDAGDWIGLGTAVVAVIAAFISAWQANIARSSGKKQLELAERVHREQNEPYVIVDIEPYMPGHSLMVLVIENIGTTVARNVRISADRPLETTWGEEPTEILQRVLTRPIPMLPPGRRLTYLFDDHDRWGTELPSVYVFTVRAEGPYGEMEPAEYTVDISTWAESLAGERPTLRLEEALDGIATHLDELVGRYKQVTGPAVQEERERMMREIEERRARRASSRTPSAGDGSGQGEPGVIPPQQ
ncbi:hypothetical protein ACGFZZ_33815 [Streptomyces tendae]|uniref:hypothetical protein n=1 Tax=Streptomyces tendae TaxID=1932 RepID=UPI0037248478